MNIYEKMVELKSFVLKEGLNKDKKGFNYSYVTGNQILAKVGCKMTELKLLLIPSSKLGTYEQYDYKNAKNVDKTEFIVKGEMTFTWINAEAPEENIEVEWAYYGQQEDVPKAYGSGLTYAERYYLLKFLGVPTDQDDPDGRNNSGHRNSTTKPTPNTNIKNGDISELQLSTLKSIAEKDKKTLIKLFKDLKIPIQEFKLLNKNQAENLINKYMKETEV